jgi:hypothetical protein
VKIHGILRDYSLRVQAPVNFHENFQSFCNSVIINVQNIQVLYWSVFNLINVFPYIENDFVLATIALSLP